MELISRETTEIHHLPNYKIGEYIGGYRIVQQIARNNRKHFPTKEISDEKTRVEEAAYFAKYAVAIFGPGWSALAMPTELAKLKRTRDIIKIF